MGFIDTMRAQGHAVESICRVLREQGCQVAARTYRAWRSGRPAARTVSDAAVMDAVRDLAWRIDDQGRRRLTPEGLYGRDKMTAHLRRERLPLASWGSVDRAMRSLGLQGVRRDKKVRTTVQDENGTRAGDLLDRCFTAPAPDLVWVTDFTYCRTWVGFVYVLVTWNQMAGWIITDRHHDHELRGHAAREHRGEVARPGSTRASRRVAHDLDQPWPCAAHHRRLRPRARGVPACL